jgi:uncharacterized protein (TIGR01777 family)
MAKVILAGGSGFLGQALGRRLAAGGWEVVVLSRDPRETAPFREVLWNGETGGAWAAELEGAAAVVNLAGRSINCVHTLVNGREILESRLNAVKALAKGYARVKNPPPVWVQCSATGYYGNAGDRFCDETLAPGPGFLAETCRLWEGAFNALELPDIRRVVLRIGVVLDAEHGALPPLAKLTRRFLGGPAGSGRQYLSWIHREDLLGAFEAALTRPDMSGPYNACSPAPVTNAEFMRELRAVLGRPWCPAAPEFVVRLVGSRLLDTEPNLALHGQRCSPARLQAAGATFKFPAVGAALRDLLAPPKD